MKKTWFDLRLYIDGLKQLKLMGILFTVVTSVVAVAIPVMKQLDYLSAGYNAYYVPTPKAVDGWGMNPLIILLFCVFAPLMTLYLFSFLNKRESSDFYHAIPATRQCLFFSFFAAVMSWVFGILVISNIAALVTYAALPHLYLINYSSILLISFTCLAGAWFVAACVAIATSVSGTVVVNLLVSLILIFFPRVLLLMVVSSIESSFPLVDGVDFVPFLSAQYNVPVGFVFAFFNGNTSTILTMWQSGVYTLTIGMLYTALAAWLFVRRRSETAGHSAPSKKLQGLFRFLVGFVISSVATLGVYTMLTDPHASWDLVDIGSAFLVYGAAILAYLIFEVFCARKLHGLIRKGASTLLWLVVANVVLLGGMYGLGSTLYLYTPDAADIESVRIVSGIGESYSYHSSSKEYFSSQVAKLKLDDPTIKEIVSKQLKHTVGLLEVSQRHYYQKGENARSLTVAIDSGLFTRYRRIYVYTEDVEQLSERLYEQPEYRKVYTSLPESVASMDMQSDKSMWMHFKNNEELNGLYDVLKEEFDALDFETKFRLTSNLYERDTPLTNLYMRLSRSSGWQYFNLPIYQTLMPKTSNRLIAQTNTCTNAADGLETLAQDAYDMTWIQVQYYQDGKVSPTHYLSLQKDAALQAQVADWLKTLHQADATTNIDTSKVFFYLRGSAERKQDDGHGQYIYTEENYCFAADPSGKMPAWLTEYLSAQSESSTTDSSVDYDTGKTTVSR